MSDSSSETEIPYTSTSLPDELGHDLLWTHPQPGRKEVLCQQTTVGEEVAMSLTKMFRMEASMETVPNRTSEGKHKHLQYAERTLRKRPHEP